MEKDYKAPECTNKSPETRPRKTVITMKDGGLID